jgi:hypothetical protein
MKYILFFATLFSSQTNFLISAKHLKNQATKDESVEKNSKPLPHHYRYNFCPHNKNYVKFFDHKIHKNILFFKEIEFMSCSQFLNTIVDDYYSCCDKEEMKNFLLTLSPEKIWELFHDQTRFDQHLSLFLEKIFTKNEFIILYEARLAIELLLFALDHTGTIEFPYTYNNKLPLKEVMKKLVLFLNEKEQLFSEILNQKDILILKKFFRKYAETTNNITFLNELQELVKILKVIGIEPGEAAGACRKMTIFARFNKFF